MASCSACSTAACSGVKGGGFGVASAWSPGSCEEAGSMAVRGGAPFRACAFAKRAPRRAKAAGVALRSSGGSTDKASSPRPLR
ncbi:MAG: hypothetical protein EBR46_06565 [Betaproteobacteria bacterium]|nr:hypothetical protein [Betaproteobacteria bacterium]